MAIQAEPPKIWDKPQASLLSTLYFLLPSFCSSFILHHSQGLPPHPNIGNIRLTTMNNLKSKIENRKSKMYPDAPRVAVGAVVFHQDKVLLVLRNQAPAKGLWAIPGGSVELGETLQAAAEREVLEETGLNVQAGHVIHTFDAIQRDEAGQVQYHYVIVDLLAEALDPTQPLRPADDVKDAAWFTLPELEQPDFPVSKTTRLLLREIMPG
jgi:ADP-ribose pyrophosphatase